MCMTGTGRSYDEINLRVQIRTNENKNKLSSPDGQSICEFVLSNAIYIYLILFLLPTHSLFAFCPCTPPPELVSRSSSAPYSCLLRTNTITSTDKLVASLKLRIPFGRNKRRHSVTKLLNTKWPLLCVRACVCLSGPKCSQMYCLQNIGRRFVLNFSTLFFLFHIYLRIFFPLLFLSPISPLHTSSLRCSAILIIYCWQFYSRYVNCPSVSGGEHAIANLKLELYCDNHLVILIHITLALGGNCTKPQTQHFHLHTRRARNESFIRHWYGQQFQLGNMKLWWLTFVKRHIFIELMIAAIREMMTNYVGFTFFHSFRHIVSSSVTEWNK